MERSVKLETIIEELDLGISEWRVYFSVSTGEIVTVSQEDLRTAEDDEPFDDLEDFEQDAREQAIAILENEEQYIELPSVMDREEYDMMKDFCISCIENQATQQLFLNAIRGKGAFSRFRDCLDKHDIVDQWYSFRKQQLKEIAREWAAEHQITVK